MKIHHKAIPDKGALCYSDLKQTKYKLLYFFMMLFMLIVLAATMIPAVWMVMSAFKEPSEIISRNQSFFPKHFDFGKVSIVWKQLKMQTIFVNTVVMSLGCMAFDVVINGICGYVLSCIKPKGSSFYLSVITWLLMVPVVGSLVPNYMLFKQLNMLDTYWPLWIMSATNVFNIMLFKSSFDNISKSLVESAMIDGASVAKIFFAIIIPLSMPVIVTVAIFTFNGSLGNFFWPYLILTADNKLVMGVKLYKMQGSGLSLDRQMMMLTFSIIPQLVIFALFQRYIVGGINVGGVKG